MVTTVLTDCSCRHSAQSEPHTRRSAPPEDRVLDLGLSENVVQIFKNAQEQLPPRLDLWSERVPLTTSVFGYVSVLSSATGAALQKLQTDVRRITSRRDVLLLPLILAKRV